MDQVTAVEFTELCWRVLERCDHDHERYWKIIEEILPEDPEARELHREIAVIIAERE